MALDPGLGLIIMVLTAPGADTPAFLSEASSPVQFDLAAHALVEPAKSRILRTSEPGKLRFLTDRADAAEIPQLLWTPLPQALLKIDPAGLRFNLQF